MIWLPFEFKRLEIPEVVLITPKVFSDERGFFMEIYDYKTFSDFGIKNRFVFDTYSRSARNVLRGLHFQKGDAAQAKLVRCISGEIFDVAVDMRKNSPTFGKWLSVILSGANKQALFIPRGFAHGFYVLSDTAEIQYKIDNVYSPKDEAGVIWNDPKLGIKWPSKKPILSEKDKKWPTLKESEDGCL